jgi:hypothetical protein
MPINQRSNVGTYNDMLISSTELIQSPVAGRNGGKVPPWRRDHVGCGDFSNSDYGNPHNHGSLVTTAVTLFSSSHLLFFRFSLILVELILDLSIFRSIRGMFRTVY